MQGLLRRWWPEQRSHFRGLDVVRCRNSLGPKPGPGRPERPELPCRCASRIPPGGWAV